MARYIDFMEKQCSKYGFELPYVICSELEHAILDLEVMPSMRALMTAGPALERDNVAGFNCAYLPIDSVRSFDELFYILLCGTGGGYSVETQYTNRLPCIPDHLEKCETIIKVPDSKVGWTESLKQLLALLYVGQIPSFDYSNVRPAGARLKTFGGRASGPEPLRDLFTFVCDLFVRARGRQLLDLECHDICCKIADIVVVGGVRRSALISLSDLNSGDLRNAKSGNWWIHNPQRALANNSAVYLRKPDIGTFMDEWTSLYKSHSGERGIFSRYASKRHLTHSVPRRNPDYEWGTNPCSEIILRPYEFCNLSEVVVRPGDGVGDLRRKVRLATILGTIQSTLTNFRYLRKVWKDNCEEERLLGVSLTGILDNELTRETVKHQPEILQGLRDLAVDTNREWAGKLGINPSVAITCVKPSGTVSQLVGSSSGIHPSYSDYYVRTVRSDTKDPLAAFLASQGVPVEPDVRKPNDVLVFSFPTKAPAGSLTAPNVTALEQLELYNVYQQHWCEHKPSITVYVRDHEWFAVADWVYRNFDSLGGVSFLPYSEHTYEQAPYQPITQEKYEELTAEFPKEIDWDELRHFESSDMTTGSQELACISGSCEIT